MRGVSSSAWPTAVRSTPTSIRFPPSSWRTRRAHRCAGLLRAVDRLLRPHALRGHRARLPASRGLLGGRGPAAARPARARGARDPARRRTQAAAVDGQPRPAGAHAAAAAGGARVHAAAGRGDATAHPGDGRRAAGGRRPRPARSISFRRSRSRCRRRSCSSFMGVPERDWPQLKEWCGSRASLGLGAAGARGAGRARDQHGRLPALPARAGRGQGRRPRRRLRQRAAGDPRRGPGRAQPRGDRVDPVLALLRRSRDDELPDRQPRPAAARGPRRWDAVAPTPS